MKVEPEEMLSYNIMKVKVLTYQCFLQTFTLLCELLRGCDGRLDFHYFVSLRTK